MALRDIFKKLRPQKPRDLTLAKLLNDYPSFQQFGDNIYNSDLVQDCIDTIATQCKKVMPQHIQQDPGGIQKIPKSSINRVFNSYANPIMTTSDFIEKVTWLLYLNYNAFIWPLFEIYKDGNGNRRKRYKGFYPLNPNQVVFEEDKAKRIYAHFYFDNGYDITLPYDEVIHLRKKFSVNDIMGGGLNGQPDNDALISILETNNSVIQGLGKAIETSLAIKGILKINTMLDDDSQKAERARFEGLLETGGSGILPIDLKGDFEPINIDPRVVDKDTMQYIDEKVLRWYGVSLPIISGDFTGDQYAAFYEKTLEPLLITMGQAFTKALFSQREIDLGNKIVFYKKDMGYLNPKDKLELIKISGEQGLLKLDQKLAILGYPPIGGEEGAVRTISLNNIDVKLANEYQMAKAKAGATNTGGANNGE